MERKKVQTRQMNIRIDDHLFEAIRDMNISELVRDALWEKLERDKHLKQCPTCKGSGYVKK